MAYADIRTTRTTGIYYENHREHDFLRMKLQTLYDQQRSHIKSRLAHETRVANQISILCYGLTAMESQLKEGRDELI